MAIAALSLAGTLLIVSSATAAIKLADSWGTDGSGDGQLHLPEDVAIDAVGNVYVADTGNGRIVKFSSSGEFLLTWGWGVKDGKPRLETCTSSCRAALFPGNGNGAMYSPQGIAVHAGRVYVSEAPRDRVEVFSKTGRFITKWGRAGSAPGEFASPLAVATDSEGRVYVADLDNYRIQKFSDDGRFIGAWGSGGSGDDQFLGPIGVATDTSGHAFVADPDNNRVERYGQDGTFLATWGYGVRTGRDRFEICTHGCQRGISGLAAGQFSDPQAIAADRARHVYVADSYRIEKFAGSGRFLTTWDTTTAFGELGGVAVGPNSNVLVTHSRGGVLKFVQEPPETTIARAKIKRHRGKARFRFRSSERGSSFRCGLDRKRYRPCDSPRRYRHLKPGRHVFTVKAIDRDKLVDPSPAKKRFRIKK